MGPARDTLSLELLEDPARFLAAAGEHLARAPVLSTVVATVAHRQADDEAAGRPRDPRHWYAVARRGSEVVGTAMRTAPGEERPAYVLPMPEGAAVGLARAVHARGEPLAAVNGALPAALLVGEELARLRGGTAEVVQHTRLFELRRLVPPRPVPGRARLATVEDLDLVAGWFADFGDAADEQGGHPPGSHPRLESSREDVLRRIEQDVVWLWVDPDGRPVHLTAAHPPALGSARIGPVYTPPAERGRGWASACVAEVSLHLLGAGVRPCLFTDQANPTSNRVYTALGYRPVVDMAEVVVR